MPKGSSSSSGTPSPRYACACFFSTRECYHQCWPSPDAGDLVGNCKIEANELGNDRSATTEGAVINDIFPKSQQSMEL